MTYWFMEDGGWTNKGIHIATNSYTKEDVLRLINVLETKYNLQCSLHSRNRIYIKTKSAKEFINIVEPYIHSDMSYKLGPYKK